VVGSIRGKRQEARDKKKVKSKKKQVNKKRKSEIQFNYQKTGNVVQAWSTSNFELQTSNF
jgi:hypothetical protein